MSREKPFDDGVCRYCQKELTVSRARPTHRRAWTQYFCTEQHAAKWAVWAIKSAAAKRKATH